ncbi:hypothetical protein niasHT_020525 [Heterodera trifolii]|uniref:Probable arginine--tRNA ligase, mitochondrial n=1 Tax=Heterodera trifolii TaxID=157864 RepID=A0ABD2J9P9_9BILA
MLLTAFRRIMFSQDLVTELLSKFSITKQRIVIDFSSPNIAKTFRMGHLRSTAYDNSMQRIFRHAGHEVNYLGDWGNKFGLLTVYWMEVMDGMDGRMARPMADEWAAMSAQKRVQLLTDAYVAANRLKLTNSAFEQKARQLQLNMESHMISTGAATVDDVNLAQIHSDDKLREAFGLWRDFRDSSVAYLEDFYARFGTKFDRWDAESYHVVEGARLTDEMIESDLCRLTRDELWAVCQPEVGLGREKITLRKGDGLNLYMNRDLAAIYARHRLYNTDKYYYLVDYGQTNHFNQLRILLRFRGDDDLADRIEHGKREADAYVHVSPTMRAVPHTFRPALTITRSLFTRAIRRPVSGGKVQRDCNANNEKFNDQVLKLKMDNLDDKVDAKLETIDSKLDEKTIGIDLKNLKMIIGLVVPIGIALFTTYKMLSTQIGGVNSDLQRQIGGVNANLQRQIGAVRNDLEKQINAVRLDAIEMKSNIDRKFDAIGHKFEQILEKLPK